MRAAQDNDVNLIRTSDGATLTAEVRSPPQPAGIVILIHGSGSSRSSPRNRAVARHLEDRGFATVRVDLLTALELDAHNRASDIDLLTQRLVDVTNWVGDRPELAGLEVGYFAASTGAAAALRAAESLGPVIGAVVSRGGRPDLAGAALRRVESPTLLIVGADDDQLVVERNKQAMAQLAGLHELVLLPGAGHVIAEPVPLKQVEHLAAEWFTRCMAATY